MLSPLRGHPAPTWTNRFAHLGEGFYTPWRATPLPEPSWVAWSDDLAQALGLAGDWRSGDMLAILTGNQPWPGSHPLASVYSGHQFGVWAGQLGDGRALWLGEIETPDGTQEIQLKGAGPTPYSRRGDGRAVLRSSIREFLCSEAMHALGIATTRALAVTASPAPVRRETLETAAVVTRTAPSFVRFGHFEHFAATDQRDHLQRLLKHTQSDLGLGAVQAGQEQRHPALDLLQDVTQRTARLMAHWQSVGFCHGVMNTDNMSILGLTLDYGPFQFMDAYDPGHICNHTDSQGRYAFGRQPRIAHWNLHALGQALMALVDDSDAILAVLDVYPDLFQQAWFERMRLKLGGLSPQNDDGELIHALLETMAADRVDHTLFWRRLSRAVAHWQGGMAQDASFAPVIDLVLDRERLQAWLGRYLHRLQDHPQAGATMLRHNPKFVLRNHLAELAIRDAQNGDPAMVRDLLTVLQSPYDEHPGHEAWADLPPDWAQHIEISCSS
jgi:uncharacterized protein YdiU (UPF0061 family)